MTLAEVIGHSAPRTLLRRLVAAGRLPPALIIEGPAGVGRRTLAQALAQAVLCPQGVEGDACGGCEACSLVAQGNHPDCTVLPSAAEKADLPVDLIRESVVEPATESPLLGHGRVFVIPSAERLKGAGANALLKVLEEPPQGVHLILTAPQAGGLLETIQSRAQVVRVMELATEDIARILERGGVAPAEARRRATLASGSHRGLWARDVDEPPLDDLRALVEGGYDPRVVADVMERLPATAADIPKGATLAGEQRRILGFWLEALLQDLRRDLRGPRAALTADRIDRVLRLRGDLGRYIQPRLIVEGLGLG